MTHHDTFVAALFDPALPPPEDIKTWNGSDPAARFKVYRNNVVVSVIDALADTFQVTQELVGEAFFRAMARVYLAEHPPRSRVLTHYGDTFADFIEQFPPAASIPYLADVARLEMLRVGAYHAADVGLLPAEAIGALLADPEQLPGLQMTLQPATRLLQSRYAVVSLWAAHQGIGDLAGVDPLTPQNALVIRRGLEVEVLQLTTGAAAFIAQLLSGATLGTAFDHAIQVAEDFNLADTLGLLIQSQAISKLQPTGSSHS